MNFCSYRKKLNGAWNIRGGKFKRNCTTIQGQLPQENDAAKDLSSPERSDHLGSTDDISCSVNNALNDNIML